MNSIINLIKIHPSVKEILLTFGGTDPNDLTKKTLNSFLKMILKVMLKLFLDLDIWIKGIEKEFQDYNNIEIFEDVKNISEYMISADIIFTSAGRTMYEIASIGVPCVCLCQNQRELTHIW